MHSNKFVLELVPIFSKYSKSNEQLFIEAILNSIVDNFGNNIEISIYPQYYYMSETQSYENIDLEKIKLCFVFDFKQNTYTLYDFIINCYEFKNEMSDFINFFTYIGFYSERFKDLDSNFKVKYKLGIKNGDYIEKKIIDCSNEYSKLVIINF